MPPRIDIGGLPLLTVNGPLAAMARNQNRSRSCRTSANTWVSRFRWSGLSARRFETVTDAKRGSSAPSPRSLPEFDRPGALPFYGGESLEVLRWPHRPGRERTNPEGEIMPIQTAVERRLAIRQVTLLQVSWT